VQRLPGQELVDLPGGLEALGGGLLLTQIEPEVSFGDDPLRKILSTRLSERLGFGAEPGSFAAASRMAERISIVSAERVRDELTKLMVGRNPRAGFTALVDSGLAAFVLPELPALKLEVDEHHHHKDVYEHTLTVLDQAIDLE